MSAPTVTVRDKGRLFDWKLLLGFLGVGVLLTLSLFTGVFDIFGGEAAGRCSTSPASPAPSRWYSRAPRWRCPAWSCSC
ncbi:hypothetical protein GS425_03150 [Rhodococcus hoagii]|nr:hypothetical protein [Prescottella equi]